MMRRLLALMLLASPAAAEPFAYEIVDGARIEAPLGGLTGDAARGAALAETHCLSCHEGEALSLDAAAARLGEAELRLAIVALPLAEPEVEDHAFYDPREIGEGTEDQIGATPLTAQQIEHVLAWLAELHA